MDIALDALFRSIVKRIDDLGADCRCGNVDADKVKAVISEEFGKRALITKKEWSV